MYDSPGAAAAASEAAKDRNDLDGRFTAICAAVRTWALAHPARVRADLRLAGARQRRPGGHRGTADARDIPATADHRRRRPGGRVPPANAETADAQAAGTALSPIRSCLPPGIPEALIQRGLMVWTGLFGVISFELNGQRPPVAGRKPVTVTPSSPSASSTGPLSQVSADRVPDLGMVSSEMPRVLPAEIEQRIRGKILFPERSVVRSSRMGGDDRRAPDHENSPSGR